MSSSVRDVLTWGSILDQEPTEVVRKVKNVFQRSKSKISVRSGNSIDGISGNDRALACLCLLMVKSTELGPKEVKKLETSLQRTSGVSPRIFSKALKELSTILSTTSVTPKASTSSLSPSKRLISRSPTKKSLDDDSKAATTEEVLLEGDKAQTSSKRKRKATVEDESETSRRINPSSIIKSNTKTNKRLSKVLIEVNDDESEGGELGQNDEIVQSPSNKRKRIKDILNQSLSNSSNSHQSTSTNKRSRTDLIHNILSPQKFNQSIHQTLNSDINENVRDSNIIIKDPPILKLPIEKVPQPNCIFQSKPIFNPNSNNNKRSGNSNSKVVESLECLNFSDWNWKMKLFESDWSEDDLKRYQDWYLNSIKSSLS